MKTIHKIKLTAVGSHTHYANTQKGENMKTTMKTAKAYLQTIGFKLSKDSETGEYRVNKTGAPESHAYYTDSIEDAIDTAIFQNNLKKGNN
jgi:hypothetical protein